MNETATLPAPAEAPPDAGFPCSADGCPNRAVYAVRFHDQRGHVHDCNPCTALLREWGDVAEVVLLPCPWVHDGTTWTDQPRELT